MTQRISSRAVKPGAKAPLHRLGCNSNRSAWSGKTRQAWNHVQRHGEARYGMAWQVRLCTEMPRVPWRSLLRTATERQGRSYLDQTGANRQRGERCVLERQSWNARAYARRDEVLRGHDRQDWLVVELHGIEWRGLGRQAATGGAASGGTTIGSSGLAIRDMVVRGTMWPGSVGRGLDGRGMAGNASRAEVWTGDALRASERQARRGGERHGKTRNDLARQQRRDGERQCAARSGEDLNGLDTQAWPKGDRNAQARPAPAGHCIQWRGSSGNESTRGERLGLECIGRCVHDVRDEASLGSAWMSGARQRRRGDERLLLESRGGTVHGAAAMERQGLAWRGYTWSDMAGMESSGIAATREARMGVDGHGRLGPDSLGMARNGWVRQASSDKQLRSLDGSGGVFCGRTGEALRGAAWSGLEVRGKAGLDSRDWNGEATLGNAGETVRGCAEIHLQRIGAAGKSATLWAMPGQQRRRTAGMDCQGLVLRGHAMRGNAGRSTDGDQRRGWAWHCEAGAAWRGWDSLGRHWIGRPRLARCGYA